MFSNLVNICFVELLIYFYKIPVYLGATEPLIPLTNKPFLFNGSDGMGDIEHLVGNFFDDNANSIEKPESAIETIHKLVMEVIISYNINSNMLETHYHSIKL